LVPDRTSAAPGRALRDPTAFVVGAQHDHDTTLWLIGANKAPRLDVTAVAERIRAVGALGHMMIPTPVEQGVPRAVA
jgi:hypothetical protein